MIAIIVFAPLLAALIAGQDPYRHQVLAMLALILCDTCDTKEES